MNIETCLQRNWNLLYYQDVFLMKERIRPTHFILYEWNCFEYSEEMDTVSGAFKSLGGEVEESRARANTYVSTELRDRSNGIYIR